MKIEKKKNRTIHQTMLISYASVAVLAVILEILIGLSFLYDTSQKKAASHSAELEKYAYRIETVLATAARQAEELSRLDSVQSLLGMEASPAYYGEDMLTVREVMEVFEDFIYHNEEIAEIYFWDRKQDVLVSENEIYHKSQCDDKLSEMGIPMSEIYKMAEGTGENLYVGSAGTSGYRLYYVERIYTTSYREADGVVLIEISEEELTDLDTVFNRDSHNQYYTVYGTAGYLGTDPDVNKLFEQMEQESGEEKENVHIRSGGKSYVYSCRKSEYTSLWFYYVSDYGSYYYEFIRNMILSILTIIGCLAGGGFLSKYYTKKNMEPLLQIMELVKKERPQREELTYDKLVESTAEMSRKSREQEDFWGQKYFSLIFNGQEWETDAILEYEEQRYGKKQPLRRILCVKMLDSEENKCDDLMLFCVGNIFNEILGRDVQESEIYSWDRVYFVLTGGKIWEEEIKNGLDLLRGHSGMDAVCGLSDPFDSYTKVRTARFQADWAVDCNSGLSERAESRLCCYSDMMQFKQPLNDREYQKSLGKFVNCIMAEEYRNSLALFEKIWKDNIADFQNDGDVSHMRMMALNSVIISAYREKMKKYERLEGHRRRNLYELYQYSKEMLLELAAQEDEGKDTSALFARIRDYILEHAADTELCAASLCEEFQVSSSGLTNLFKKYSGEGCLNFIHRERIRRAKICLREGKNVKETAEECGYIDSRALIRAFKREEGITPGQFKEAENAEK